VPLSDPQAEDAIYDSESMRRFTGVELGDDVVPDETTILRFRHLLEHHRLTEAIFTEVKGLLEAKRLLVHSGTIVDATIIAAPSSTKNATQTRDPEMKQGRKGKTWYFGMKVHVGADPKGMVHSLTTTHAGAADITQRPALLHGAEREIYGDQAYWSEPWRQHCRARGIRFRVNRRPHATAPLSETVATVEVLPRGRRPGCTLIRCHWPRSCPGHGERRQDDRGEKRCGKVPDPTCRPGGPASR
jgi:IS5 family transposase